MKTFEVTYNEVELIHYATTVIIEAENEKEAIERALNGEGQSDYETYNYSGFDMEVAKEYVAGELPFISDIECKKVPSKEEIATANLEKELLELESKMVALRAKLNK
jgi:hypothetical protein